MVRLFAPLLLGVLTISGMGCAGPDRQGSDAGGRSGVRGVPAVNAGGSSLPGMLPFFYDLYSFRGDTGTTAVVASFAVRVGRLDRERIDGGVRHRFNVTLVLADTVQGDVSRADDSVFVAVERPLARDHLLHAHLEVQARPSTTTVQRVIMIDAPQPGTGQLYTHPFVVPDYSGSELMLSDVALGLPEREGGWKRGDVTLALLPSDHFPGGIFDVYYEIYNLPRGNRYTTEIAFEPVGEPGDPPPGPERSTNVRFSGESAAGPDSSLSELRRVQAPLPRGRYRLTVTVTDLDRNLTARRSRLLQIREWRAGATLVPTCPMGVGADRTGCAGLTPGGL